ncbi:MAG: glycerol-3-phosphate responsive antiterminator [Pirellulales bacterium]|nr:glycerol-3-phosphate responsive antiterminator [Pirellulales bacterium]
MKKDSIATCFRKPVIPVLWDPAPHAELLTHASCVTLQGGTITDLARNLELFDSLHLDHLPIFVHIDLVAGLENNEAGVDYMASLPQVSGIVTVHHHIIHAIRKQGLLSVLRLFLSDSRAVDRGLAVAGKSHPDAIEILPGAIAPKVAADFAKCRLPRIAGGLCRTQADVAEILASGCVAASSTCSTLWQININPS